MLPFISLGGVGGLGKTNDDEKGKKCHEELFKVEEKKKLNFSHDNQREGKNSSALFTIALNWERREEIILWVRRERRPFFLLPLSPPSIFFSSIRNENWLAFLSSRQSQRTRLRRKGKRVFKTFLLRSDGGGGKSRRYF